jgi:hypothetical protein
VHLASEPIVLVLASEFFAIKSCKNVLEASCGFGQHGFAGNTQSELTFIVDLVVIVLDIHQFSQHFFLIGVLGNCLLYAELILNEILFGLFFVWKQLLE